MKKTYEVEGIKVEVKISFNADYIYDKYRHTIHAIAKVKDSTIEKLSAFYSEDDFQSIITTMLNEIQDEIKKKVAAENKRVQDTIKLEEKLKQLGFE